MVTWRFLKLLSNFPDFLGFPLSRLMLVLDGHLLQLKFVFDFYGVFLILFICYLASFGLRYKFYISSRAFSDIPSLYCSNNWTMTCRLLRNCDLPFRSFVC